MNIFIATCCSGELYLFPQATCAIKQTSSTRVDRLSLSDWKFRFQSLYAQRWPSLARKLSDDGAWRSKSKLGLWMAQSAPIPSP